MYLWKEIVVDIWGKYAKIHFLHILYTLSLSQIDKQINRVLSKRATIISGPDFFLIQEIPLV